MMLLGIRSFLCALVIGSMVVPVVGASSHEQLLEQAVDAYQSAFESEQRNERVRLFRKSELLFGQVIDQVESSPQLFVNHGNAAFGAERIGPAIYSYRRALQIDPHHRQAIQNLDHARQLLPSWVPRPDQSTRGFSSFFAWTESISEQKLFMGAALCFFFSAAMFATAIRTERTGVRNLALLPLLLWIVLVVAGGLRQMEPKVTEAVVLLPDTYGRSADSANSPPRFPDPLPGGVEVRVTQQRGDWLHVQLHDGRDAWLPASSVGLIN